MDLLNRLDLDPADSQSAESLRAPAQLAPDAFVAQLKEMLYTHVQLLRSPVLLDALLHLDSEGDPPGLHSLCRERCARGGGVARGAGTSRSMEARRTRMIASSRRSSSAPTPRRAGACRPPRCQRAPHPPPHRRAPDSLHQVGPPHPLHPDEIAAWLDDNRQAAG